MNQRRAKPAIEPTIVDTIITAVAPALIICMISSLVFFLIIAFYRSEYSSRLMYILGLYTFATVLVARIAIESGRTHANLFGIALFAAACVAMFRFVTISGPMAAISPVINVGLLLVAWYLADRITFDCTLVDERDESIQKGLLQSLNLVDKDPPSTESTERIQDNAKVPHKAKRKSKKHNPGVWVLYFALLAIPLFGLGQVAIPDEAVRRQAFMYLLIYLACALTLLLTTSFVGMRRYLRQRGVEMPGEMTRLWLASGIAGIAVILIGCLVLPLPTKRGVGFAWLPFDFTSPQGLSPSKWGWGNEGTSQSKSQSSQNEGDQSSTVTQNTEQSQQANGSPQENGKGPQEPSESGQKQSSQSGQSKPDTNAKAKSADSSSSKPTKSDSKENASNSDSKSEPSKSTPSNAKQSSSNDKGANQPKTKNEPTKSSDNADSESSSSENDKPSENDKENPESKNDRQSESNQQNNPDNRKPQNTRPSEQPNSEKPKSEKPSEDKPEKTKSGTSRESVDRPNAATPPPSNPTSSFQFPSNLSASIKWILIAVLIGILLVYALTHPKEIAQLWNDLLRMFDGLFGSRSRKPSPVANGDALTSGSGESTIRPFSSFPDPFREGSGMNPKEVVAHTFAALEAWAEERGNRRATDQTAEEFARQLARKQPKIASHATSAAQMLDRVMFAGWTPTSKDVSDLAKLWMLMKST